MRIRDFPPNKHPDLSDHVVHLIGRGRAENKRVDAHIQALSASERFHNIIMQTRFFAYPIFATDEVPVICFSECTPSGIGALVKSARYWPIGIAFTKNYIFQCGGGPAFYVRGDEWAEMCDALEGPLRGRLQRLWPGAEFEVGEVQPYGTERESYWWHEREWRYIATADCREFEFDGNETAFFILPADGSVSAPDECKDIPVIRLNYDGSVASDDHGIWSNHSAKS